MIASRLLLNRTLVHASSRLTTSSACRSGGGVALRRWFASYPPHEVVGMPSLSPTMESGSIAAWNLGEGEAFAAGDVLCQVETDKATVDFEAQDEGVIAKILKPAGDGATIDCGVPIVITVEDADSVSAFQDYVAEETSGGAPPPAAAPPAAEETPSAPPPAAAPPATPAPAATGDRVVASPLAHMLAKEKGHDLTSIPGTGPGGRVIAADVNEYVPSATESIDTTTPAAASAAAPPMVGSGYIDYPLDASAQELAARLSQSKRSVPHYYLTVDLCVDSLLEMRDTLNASSSKDNGDDSIGVYELLLKAAAVSMKAVPVVNASWMDSVVRVYDQVDINVAVGSGDGLYMPVMDNVATKGLKALSQDLQQAMKAVSEDDEEVMGPNFSAMGTLTVLNLGMYGIKSCAPIIREPQASALALGAIENKIVPSDSPDELYKESAFLTATMSFDHRVVDGAVGAQWLAAFKSHVENPHTLLL